MSDQSAVWLSCNHIPWRKLRKLMLDNSGIRELGVEFLRHSRACKEAFVSSSKSERARTHWRHKRLKNRSPGDVDFNGNKVSTPKYLKESNSLLKRNEIYSRGGGRGEVKSEGITNNQILLELLDKINQYKMRMLNNKSFDKELNLYVEVQGKQSSDVDSESFEVTFGIQKHLLGPESKLRVLLLTGEAGIGKTLFCRRLQRVLLSELDLQRQEFEERPWLPIFVDLSSLKLPEPSVKAPTTKIITVPEILRQELSLNEAEIKLLQENKSVFLTSLPRLLFILDNYSETLGNLTLSDLRSSEACIQNNFCAAIGFETEWKHSKMIATHEAETLSHLIRRDLLFGPLDKSTSTVIPNTFAKFMLQPFNNTQISSYLKKFVVLDNSEKLIEEEAVPSSLNSESWKSLRKYENLIETHELRELVRVPLTLHVFTRMVSDNNQEKNEGKAGKEVTFDIEKVQPNLKKWSRYILYRSFTTQLINTTAGKLLSSKTRHKGEQIDEQQLSLLSEKLSRQLQDIALRLDNYTLNSKSKKEVILEDPNDNCALLALCPLLKHDSSKTGSMTFTHQSFQAFFVASKTVEEILESVNVEASSDLTRMIFNQKSLVKGKVSGLIFRFLVDAVHDQTIQASALIKLIQNSKIHDSNEPKKQFEMETEVAQEIKVQKAHRHHHPPIAAANAITILNASGYDFSLMDVSEVCIPNANLSYGVFDGTNFTSADLQGVDFSGSSLQDTIFVRARMNDVNFGITPDLILDHEGSCIAHSPDGTCLVIGVRSEILVFEKQIVPAVRFREIRRIKGHVGNVSSCSFSKDGKYLITSGQDNTVRIWDFKTGECLHILRGHKSGEIKCKFSQDEKHIVSVDKYQRVNKWSLTEKGWTLWFQF